MADLRHLDRAHQPVVVVDVVNPLLAVVHDVLKVPSHCPPRGKVGWAAGNLGLGVSRRPGHWRSGGQRHHSGGETRYIYHGNDGTTFAWNETAQLDYSKAYVREHVIQTILHVARLFPIIRFDAAMVREIELDHTVIAPLWLLLPDDPLPIVPVFVKNVAGVRANCSGVSMASCAGQYSSGQLGARYARFRM